MRTACNRKANIDMVIMIYSLLSSVDRRTALVDSEDMARRNFVNVVVE
jgi:hypothetical protein